MPTDMKTGLPSLRDANQEVREDDALGCLSHHIHVLMSFYVPVLPEGSKHTTSIHFGPKVQKHCQFWSRWSPKKLLTVLPFVLLLLT